MAGALARRAAQAPPQDREIGVWAENLPAVNLFLELFTQRSYAGMGAFVGFRHEVLYARLDRLYQDKDRWEAAYADFRVMELAAVEAANKT